MSDISSRLATALQARYTINNELGSGGMATVYLATDLKHGRRVAIKVLRPELAATLGPDRFVREIEIAANLTHPHILPLFDSGEADGFLYYVMPYVEGESLRELLVRETKVSMPDVIRLTQQIASALTYAHERGVIHRDIKPENILLTGDQAIVADFGIARAVEAAAGEKLTVTGMAIGTPAYMSPEQAFGSGDVNAATDVYALGCMVFEMLTGQTPFDGPTPQALLAKHAVGPLPSMRTSDPEIPAPLERAVHRALAKAPADRFESATALAEALVAGITPEAKLAEERRVARGRWTRALLAAGSVAVLALGGWWLSGAVKAQPIELLAVLPASNMTRDSTQDYFVDGVHEALVTELQRAGLSIIARQSVLQYRDTDKPIRQIARELGVDALIQPAVGREGDRVIVDVTLYDGESQLPLWTESFPARIEGVLGLYRDVSRRVADEIGAVLTAPAEGRLAERPTVDPQVYEAVLKGEFHRRRYTPQDFTTALEYFEQALAIDSLYAPAHVGVAWVWGSRAQAGLIPSAKADSMAGEHLAKALELDPQLPKARFLEASRLVWSDWDIETGATAFRQTLELDPNDAEIQVLYGHVLAIQGRVDDAVQHGERAMELDPLNPFVPGLYGTLLLLVGRTDEAIEVIRKRIEQDPASGFGVDMLIDAYYASGRLDEALELRRTVYSTRGDRELVEALDRGAERGGYVAAMKGVADALAARSRKTFVQAMSVGGHYAMGGEAETAIDWLDVAVEQRDQNIPYIGTHPNFRNLYSNTRFQKLLQDAGVPLWKIRASLTGG